MLCDQDLDYKSLGEVLGQNDYALALSPGFFRFYALTGVLAGLERQNSLRATHVSGSSAGALVGGFLSSGWSPNDMIDTLLQIKREDIWDVGGVGGLLQGKRFQELLRKNLKVEMIENCLIPYGATAYDLLRFKTTCIHQGCLATAIRASCTFPGLFQPVLIDNLPHIDGGVFDDSGLMALPGVPESNLIVNIVCGEGREASSKLPSHLPNALLLTIVLRNIPMVSPFSMTTVGPIAYRLSKEATLRALSTAKVIRVGSNHWVSHIDGPAFHSTHPPSPPLSQPQHTEEEREIASTIITEQVEESEEKKKRKRDESEIEMRKERSRREGHVLPSVLLGRRRFQPRRRYYK